MHIYTVTELAKLCGTTSHAVRHYTRMGLLHPQRHPGNGYRLYSTSEIPWLKFVRRAKNLGYTLKEIKSILFDANDNKSPCPKVRKILLKRIDENRQRLDDMMSLQLRMENALSHWENMPDGIPTGQSVCHLIDSMMNGTQTKNIGVSTLKH